MQAIKLKMQTLTKERDDALARVGELEKRVQKSQGQTAATDDQLSQIQEKTDACEARLEKSQANMDNMQTQLNEVNSLMDEYQIRLQRSLKLSGEDGAKSNSMASRYQNAMKAADDAATTMEGLNKRIEQLEEQLAATDDRVAKADDTVAATEVELRQVVDQIRSCNASSAGAGNRTAKLSAMIETKERAKAAASKRLTNADDKADQLEKRMVEAEQEVIDWQQKTEQAKKEFEESVSMLQDI